MKKIAVIGTVGVPANYGGFEMLVENLLTYKQNPELKYQVYCSKNAYSEHPNEYKGARLIYLPLKANGAQALFYDSLSLLHACFTADMILVLGCSCPIYPLVKIFCHKRLVVNVDGIETARDKWSGFAKRVLAFCTKGAVRAADIRVSDNSAIRDYLHEKYTSDSVVIEYGGDNAFSVRDDERLKNHYGLRRGKYAFKVARIEPENNIEMVLKAFTRMPEMPLVLVGNWNRSTYGIDLRTRFANSSNLMLLDPIYDTYELNLLRSNCRLYIHGHSAGGTNPSLVEAMSLALPIFAFDVKYNRATTEGKAYYFDSANTLYDQVQSASDAHLEHVASDMREIARRRYCWTTICKKYEHLFI